MRKILIVKLGALGDVIMATSLIRQIQRNHKNDEVWLLTTPPFASLFLTWHNLNVKALPRQGFIASMQTVLWIRRHKFARLYDLQSNDRTGFITALSGIKERAGNHPRFPYNLHPDNAYDGTYHIFDRMNEILVAAGIESTKETPCLPVNEHDQQIVQEFMSKHDLTDHQFVILHAGASSKHAEKRWPYYEQLAIQLQQKGLNIVWIGAGEDAVLNQRLAATVGIDATGEFNLTQLSELGKHARFAVTNDSGPMHVLSSSGIPVYAFFGPTNWRRNHAIGQRDRVITHQPDNIVGKYFNTPEYALKNIQLDEVIQKIDKEGLLPA